jgi:hypothetical protein
MILMVKNHGFVKIYCIYYWILYMVYYHLWLNHQYHGYIKI